MEIDYREMDYRVIDDNSSTPRPLGINEKILKRCDSNPGVNLATNER